MAKTESNLENDDLLLVNRGSDSYNATIQTASDKFTTNLTIFDAPASMSPPKPTVGSATTWNIGQLWYNTQNGLLYIYKPGDVWDTVGGANNSASAPGAPMKGDFHMDASSHEVYARNANNDRWMGIPYISGLQHLPL